MCADSLSVSFCSFFVSISHSESIKYGMRGEEISSLQSALISLGYLEGNADGIFGSKTERAVRNFQRANKLHVDGVAGNKTQAALAGYVAGALFDGDYTVIDRKADPVRIKKLQNALITVNYLSSSADRIFGSVTRSAVVAFQKENGLKADGTAGKQTLAALESAVASGYRRESPLDAAKTSSESGGKTEAPDKTTVELLYWDDIKPILKNVPDCLYTNRLQGSAGP